MRTVAAPTRIASHDGADGVHPVEVVAVGEQQARGGAPDVAVDGDAAAEQRVRAVTHPPPSSAARARRPVAVSRPRPERARRAGWRPAPSRRRPPRSRRRGSRPDPAAPNTQAVAPSRGPQPATLGSTIAAIASSASGSTREGGAVTPAVRAAIRNISGVAEHDHGGGEHDRGQRAEGDWADRPPPVREHGNAGSHGQRDRDRGITEPTGEGSTSSTTTVSTICTSWPSVRSHATARNARPTSPTSRPWLTPRCTSPTTPPGSARLRNTDR